MQPQRLGMSSVKSSQIIAVPLHGSFLLTVRDQAFSMRNGPALSPVGTGSTLQSLFTKNNFFRPQKTLSNVLLDAFVVVTRPGTPPLDDRGRGGDLEHFIITHR